MISHAQSRRLAALARQQATLPREQRLMQRITPSAFESAIPQPEPVLVVDSVPEELIFEWGTKLYMLMNLTWSYIDTVIDLCIQQRIPDTKPLVRRIRELRRLYDRFRHKSIDDEHESMETHNAEVFEYKFSADFDRLFNGLDMEVGRLRLKPAHRDLVIAVQQALTLMDAVKVYARQCDAEIQKLGVWTCDCCLVQAEFLQLYPLIPQFAGDCYRPDISARAVTARILANRLSSLSLKPE